MHKTKGDDMMGGGGGLFMLVYASTEISREHDQARGNKNSFLQRVITLYGIS